MADRNPMLEMLAEAAKQFRFYEVQHRSKVPATADTLQKAEVNRAFAARIERLIANRGYTADTAPIGTMAPSVSGGHWYRTDYGWKWNGPGGNGGTFPHPGGDWCGELHLPASTLAAPPPAAMTTSDVLRIFRPLPAEEAAALRAVIGDGTSATPAPGGAVPAVAGDDEPTAEMIQAACDATFGPSPMTPEEIHRRGYVAMRRVARATPAPGGGVPIEHVMQVAWEVFGGNHTPAEAWHEFSAALRSKLRAHPGGAQAGGADAEDRAGREDHE